MTLLFNYMHPRCTIKEYLDFTNKLLLAILYKKPLYNIDLICK